MVQKPICGTAPQEEICLGQELANWQEKCRIFLSVFCASSPFLFPPPSAEGPPSQAESPANPTDLEQSRKVLFHSVHNQNEFKSHSPWMEAVSGHALAQGEVARVHLKSKFRCSRSECFQQTYTPRSSVTSSANAKYRLYCNTPCAKKRQQPLSFFIPPLSSLFFPSGKEKALR